MVSAPDPMVLVTKTLAAPAAPDGATAEIDVSLLTVKLVAGVPPNDTAVKSWIVSFTIVSQPDSRLTELVNDGGKPSVVDTTGTDGVAGRQLRLHPLYLTSTTVVDSVIINASARYRGALVAGSPMRIVVKFKPRS